MLKSYHDFYLLNGKIKPSSEYDPGMICQGPSVYEVFRLIEGVPLFLEEHLLRLYNSAGFLKKQIPFTHKEILEQVKTLSSKNKVDFGNIEIIVNFCNENDQDARLILLFIEQRYPSQEEYENGVGAITFDAVRFDPHIKQINLEMRQNTSSTIDSNNLYEVILLTPEKIVTEGSRSNLYFIKNNIVYTIPVELVLPGITRDKIFEICKKNNIPIKEMNIHLDKIKEFDAAFISGTSPKILPLQYIDSIKYNTKNRLLQDLIRMYDEMILKYVKSRINLI